MLELLLAAAVFLSAGPASAGVPAATFVSQEPAARAAAQSYTADICRRASASCAEAKALAAAYTAALDSATECDRGGKCSLPDIWRQAKAVAALDVRDGALPRPAEGRPDRAFLALSVIATSRLTSAATRLGSPYGGSASGPDDRAEAEKSLAGYCLATPPNCAAMSALVDKGTSLGERIKACASQNCPLEAADPLVDGAQGSFSTFFTLSHLATAETTPIFTFLNGVNKRGIALYTPLADGAVADLSRGADKLQKNLDLAEKDASVPMTAVEAAGPPLLENNRRAALAADRLSYYLGYADPKNGAQVRREEVNAVAIRLSGLRARAFALRTARGLGEDKAGPGAVGASPAGAGRGAGVAPGLVMTQTPRTFLDRRLVPAPSGPKAAAPPILPGEPSYPQLLRRSYSDDPAVRADALRRLGQTVTVGDPGRYAPQAFSQEGDDSCAVAAQVQVLRAHGLLPMSVNPKVQERALVAEARRRGLMKGGTAPEYTASLLIERGMLVDKHTHAAWPKLEAALRRGGIIQASVDARKLWTIEGPNPLAHSILITGTEVSKGGNEILGVYINDSGTDPAGAGKFMTLSAFRAAWANSFAEVR